MIHLENVGVSFPNGTRAVHGVNLELSADQFTAISGPSGAGKSTLIRVLNGLVYPTILDKIKNLHTKGTIATENSGTPGQSILIPPSEGH